MPKSLKYLPVTTVSGISTMSLVEMQNFDMLSAIGLRTGNTYKHNFNS